MLTRSHVLSLLRPRRLWQMLRSEDGAVTIDWVILAAGVLIFAAIAAVGLPVLIGNASQGIGARVLEAANLLPN